jgi:hypothetical protein
MQISTTIRPASTRQPEAAQPTQDSKPTLKPLHEKWTVGEDTFNSTQELLANVGDLHNVEATYHYRAQDEAQPFTLSEKLKNAAGVGMGVSVAGAAGGAVVGGGLVFMAGLADLLNALVGGRSHGAGNALMLVPVAIGTALGAAAGAGIGYSLKANAAMEAVDGVLSREAGEAAFYPKGQVEAKVDLNKFQEATTPPVSPAKIEQAGTVSSVIKGGLAGALMAPASVIPLVGLAIPPVVGYHVGEAVGDRTALGKGAGVLAGAATVVGSYAAMSSGGAQAFAALAGGLALGGAVVGKKVFSEMGSTPARRDYGQQWWNRYEDKQTGI